ncbi:MAG: hypothetical protein ACYDG3_00405 [Bacillati bacterium]
MHTIPIASAALPPHAYRKERPTAPRCYVLDEGYRVVLACASSPNDPLNVFFGSETCCESLPAALDRAVRALTASWSHGRQAEEGIVHADGIRASVVPLHGPNGRHIGVFVEDPEPL